MPLIIPRRLGGYLTAGAASLALLTGTAASGSAAATPPAAPATSSPYVPAATLSLPAGAPCGQMPAGYASCQVIVTPIRWNGLTWSTRAPASRPRTAPAARAAVKPGAPVAPFMAADLQSAYKLPSALLGGRQTIAIVDAYDDPNAAADLAAYRAGNHLPACDATFQCFTEVNQDGAAGPPPAADANWAVEESLDLDMASAICPNCKIILVEANDSSFGSLAAAEDTAAKLGATVISNSWGGTEFTGQDGYAADFSHPGVAVVASTGDFGFETGDTQVPAAYPSVTAVGGTTLYPAASGRGWAESAWGGAAYGAGSGCSGYEAKPRWQHDRLCPTRAIADVSAVADPATPVAIYDTYGIAGGGGWLATGGTSVAAPVIAGVYALAGNADIIGPGASYLYAHSRALHDVATQPDQFDINPGSNGVCGSGYLCDAAAGYDGPTGNGTPDGIGAF